VASTFPQRTVHSFDLVAANPNIIACNIAKVPLKSDSIDAAIYCLSLMGTDWPDFLIEGHRVLKLGGVLKIAEVQSRIPNLEAFINAICSIGFTLEESKDIKSFFTLLQFSKSCEAPDGGQLITRKGSLLQRSKEAGKLAKTSNNDTIKKGALSNSKLPALSSTLLLPCKYKKR